MGQRFPRYGGGTSAGAFVTLTSGSNSVNLLLNTTANDAVGGVGQYTIGTFTADAMTQTFTLPSSSGFADYYLNAIQLRDTTPTQGFFSGASGTIWDASTTSDWSATTSGPYNTTWNALGNPATATFEGTANSVTVNGAINVFGISFTTDGYTLGGSGTLTLLGGGNSITTGAGQDTIGAILGGSAGLIKNGAGTLTLSGTNTYSGPTTVSAGTLRAGSSTAFNTTSALVMSGTSTLDLNGFNAVFISSTGGASTNLITNNGTGSSTNTLTIGTGTGTNYLSAVLAPLITDGSNGDKTAIAAYNNDGSTLINNLNNTFSGGLTLLGNNTVPGRTRLTPITGATFTTTGGVTTVTKGPYGTGAITIGSTATDQAQIFFTGTAVTLANALVVNSAVGVDVNGTIRVDNPGLVIAGAVQLNNAGITIDSYTAGSLTISGQITSIGGPGTGVTVQNAVYLAANQNKATNLILANAGPANSYTGDTTVNYAQGIITLGAANQIPDGVGKGNLVLTNGGTFNMAGFSETINGLNGTGTVDGVSGTPTLTVGGNNATAAFSGIIKNTAGTLSMTKTGAGTQTISGANSYTGVTTVSAGTLAEGSTGSIADTSNLTVNGATAIFDLGANHSDTVGTVTLQGGGSINGSGSSALTANTGQTFEMQSGSVIAILAGSGIALNKTTSGTVTLAGANTYTGATNVNLGTLFISGASSLGNNSATSLNGGTLVIANGAPTRTVNNSLVLNGGTLQGGFQDNLGTGGSMTLDGNGKLTYVFTAGGTLTVPFAISGASALLVGGGGGGGGGVSGFAYSYGGGGGKVYNLTGLSLSSGATSVTVGAGGVGVGNGAGNNGSSSSLGANTAAGGSGPVLAATNTGKGGASGSGMVGGSIASSNGGGGGGGDSAIGGNGTAAGGAGGAGSVGTITGLTYGGGGGQSGTTQGAGGAGGGGAGGAAGTTNTGGGGGGAGNGGSGIVVVQYAYNAFAVAGTLTLGGSIDLQTASTLDAYGNGGLIDVTGVMSTTTGTGGINISSSNSAGGVVRYSNAMTYLGDATINGGATLTLADTGSITSATNVVVSPGAKLRGTGATTGSQFAIKGAGLVYPGTTVHAGLPLSGNETLNAGSADFSAGTTLGLQISRTGGVRAQSLTVSGTATLTNGNLLVGAEAGSAGAYGSGSAGDIIVLLAGANGIQTSFPPANVSIPTGFTLVYKNGSTDVPNPSNVSFADRVVLRPTGAAVTPVTIDSFTAQPEGAGVHVSWDCISEFQNVGFNVYRRPVEGGSWNKVNPSMIAGRITNPDKKTYHVYDWATPGVFEYKLESVSVMGFVETYSSFTGPVTVDRGDASLADVSSEGIDTAVSSIGMALNVIRTQAAVEKFDALVAAAANNSNANSNTNAANANASVALRATVKVFDETRGAQVADVAAVSVNARSAAASPATHPMVAARWFSGGSISTASTTFTGAKVVYCTPGVMLIPLASLPTGINVNHLAIQREGVTIPALAITPSGLLVLGQGYEDDYTANDALFLRPINGSTAAGQMISAQGLFVSAQTANVDSPASVTAAYHDVYFDYSTAYRPYTFAPWFSSAYLTASDTAGTTQSFNVTTPYASGSAATLTVNLWSLTQDHALQVLVNGQPAGQATWSGGNKMVQLTFQVPSNILIAGSNRVQLVTPPITGVTSQVAFLHSLTFAYTRTLDGSQPVNIYNSSTSSQLYDVSHLPSANVWVVDARFPTRAALVPYEAQKQLDNTYKARFIAAGGGTGQYQVVPAGLENAPISVARVQVKPVKPTGVYLATGPSQFSAGVQPLLMQRAKEGLRGQFVDQQQMFDYYNYGRYGPVGIQKAVQATKPQYLLLLGRTIYDYKNYSNLNPPIDPLCPAFLVPTTFWGQTTSDSVFGDLGRGYPEVAVGRLPVTTTDELNVAVKHVLNYAGAPVSGIRVHAVADQADPKAADFPAQATALGQMFPDISWDPNYLGVTYQTQPEATSAMQAAASSGADWVIYIGHGNAARLGGQTTILNSAYVQNWTGDVVFLQSTCTANWMAKDVYDYKSIAIQALTQPQGGIAASIATSTYMNSDYAVPFMSQLMKYADKGAGTRWGNALMKTQQWAYQQGAQSSFYLDLGRTEQIFGDPAMPVYSPKATTTSGAANSSQAGSF